MTQYDDWDYSDDGFYHDKYRHEDFYEEFNPEDYEELICMGCSGSGEGMWDGATCSSCGGSGVEYRLFEKQPEEEEDE